MASASQRRRAERDLERMQQRLLASFEQDEQSQVPLETTGEIVDAAKKLAKHFGRPANKMAPRKKLAPRKPGQR